MAFQTITVQGTSSEVGPEPRTRGRPHTLEMSPNLGLEIAKYLEKGMYFDSACARAGVASRSARDWLMQGRKDVEAGNDTTPPATFWYDIQEGEAKFEEHMHQKMEIAGNDPRAWMANAWRLERRYPERYGKADRVNINVAGQMAVGIATLPDSLGATLDTEVKVHAAQQIGSLLAILGTERGTAAFRDDSDEWEDSSTEASFELE
jgi:transposase